MEAAAVVDIGLSRAEFWALTARQFWNFFDRYTERQSGAKPKAREQAGRELLTAMKFSHELLAAKGAPKGEFGKLSAEELDALYAERHRIYPQFGKVQ
jgi:hypothetical protein